MRNAGLEETQAGIKIAGRNINNVTYVDDTTLTAAPAPPCGAYAEPHRRPEAGRFRFSAAATRLFTARLPAADPNGHGV